VDFTYLVAMAAYYISSFHWFDIIIPLQERAQEYIFASKIFKTRPPFSNWLLKPVDYEAFSVFR
jgi:hypothetical protein